MADLETRAEELLRRVAADRLPVDSGAVARMTALIREAREAGRQSVFDEQTAIAAEILGELEATRPAEDLADRVAEILADAGYTDARLVFPGGFLVTGGPGHATTGWLVVSVPWTDASDGERRRLLGRFAEALRDGGMEVAPRGCYLQVRAMPGEAPHDA